MPKRIVAGIIAEDDSDVDVAFTLISRICGRTNFTKYRFVGGGCGRVRNKLTGWCENLHQRGCNRLIVVHDLDENELPKLHAELSKKITDAKAKIEKEVIVIPIEEIEAWMLSDMEAIRSVFGLKKAPKVISNPEKIRSPKEHLEALVYRASDKEKRYLNTRHNLAISEKLKLSLLSQRCPSFKQLEDFVSENF